MEYVAAPLYPVSIFLLTSAFSLRWHVPPLAKISFTMCTLVPGLDKPEPRPRGWEGMLDGQNGVPGRQVCMTPSMSQQIEDLISP